MRPVLALLLVLALAPPAPQAQECGGADSPCRVGLGEYHASVPQRPASERAPAVVQVDRNFLDRRSHPLEREVDEGHVPDRAQRLGPKAG